MSVQQFEQSEILGGVEAQHTLLSPIGCTGVGVHGGLPVSLRLLPAPEHHGIVFRRVDLSPAVEIPALWNRVADTRLCTVLASEDKQTSVGTVEHLMAALAGCGIDNAVIELDGPEVPIMDGSAEPFVFLIECAGIAAQRAPRRAIKILKPVSIADGDRRAAFTPAPATSLGLEIDFASAAIGRQRRFTAFGPESFREDLSRARTFGFLHEVEALRQAGLGLGGSLDNAVVIEGDRVLNEDGLRFEDEFVRHKLLDAVGDLYLAGMPVIGHFEGMRSGHAMNNRLLRALFAAPDCWVETVMPSAEAPLAALGGGMPRPHKIAAAAAR